MLKPWLWVLRDTSKNKGFLPETDAVDMVEYGSGMRVGVLEVHKGSCFRCVERE